MEETKGREGKKERRGRGRRERKRDSKMEKTLLADALMASNSSRKGSRLYLSTFRRLVPESGVMLNPITSDIYGSR